MYDWLSSPEAWIALATLAALEIVLGIDNIIFISILVGRLPPAQRPLARRLGLGLAMVARLALLFVLSIAMALTQPLLTVWQQDLSGRDLILIGGGLFLLAKSTREIHHNLEGERRSSEGVATGTLGGTLFQIALLDVVFSLDSVITAVGLVDEVAIMAVAIVLAVLVMLVAAQPIGRFVDTHPTIKILGLSFLILVGVTLLLEGFGVHVPKGYIYFAMAFSMGVEMLNLRMRPRTVSREPARRPYAEERAGPAATRTGP